MATKLNQIIAVEKGVKQRAYADLTAAHQTLAKSPLLSGIARQYTPKDDDGDRLPPESTKVQVRTNEALKQVETALTRLFDVTLTKDVANTQAAADIVVGGAVIAREVPVTFLMFLEKQLVDLHTFVTKIPVLDPSETWTFDPTVDAYATAPTQTTKTKKVPRNHVKAPATEKHPAQVELWYEDINVGTWTTVKFSGALPQPRVNELRTRVVDLQDAVRVAREAANSEAVVDQKVGEKIFGYLFAE